jgi:hypothetical protein
VGLPEDDLYNVVRKLQEQGYDITRSRHRSVLHVHPKTWADLCKKLPAEDLRINPSQQRYMGVPVVTDPLIRSDAIVRIDGRVFECDFKMDVVPNAKWDPGYLQQSDHLKTKAVDFRVDQKTFYKWLQHMYGGWGLSNPQPEQPALPDPGLHRATSLRELWWQIKAIFKHEWHRAQGVESVTPVQTYTHLFSTGKTAVLGAPMTITDLTD